MPSLPPLEAVFDSGYQKLRSTSGDSTTFSFTGDICLIREVEQRLREDAQGAVMGIRDALAADYVIGNLETPLAANAALDPIRGVLNSAPELATVLPELGFDAFTLANNHTMDCGADGLGETLSFLQQNNIAHFGADTNEQSARKPLIVKRNNITIGLLGYSQPELDAAEAERAGVAPLRKDVILEDVAKLRSQVEVVVLTLHEGYEFQNYPRLDFLNLCHELAQSGVHLICGHHPHVMQGMETVGNCVILYSLGNFWFDMPYQHRVQQSRNSAIAHVTFDQNGATSLKVTPTIMDDGSRLRVAQGETRENILQHLKEISHVLQNKEEIRSQNKASAERVMQGILGAVYRLGEKGDKAGFEKYIQHQIHRDPYLKTFCDFADLVGGYKSTF